MKRIDFYQKKKDLHNEMLEAIVALFEKAGFDEIDFLPEGEWQRNAYVLYCPDGAYSIQEFHVWKVRCRDGIVEVLAEGDEDEHWISCEHAGDIMTDSLDSLYEAVYDEVADLNHVYYVCDLDDSGIPTGITCKRTWRLEFAENFIEERKEKFGKSYVYNDAETALLHAKWQSKMKSEINYKGEKFIIRNVFHIAGGYVNIGGLSLEHKLVVNGDYPDKEAQAIDEQIYGYVDDEILERLTDEEFKRYVNRHLD